MKINFLKIIIAVILLGAATAPAIPTYAAGYFCFSVSIENTNRVQTTCFNDATSCQSESSKKNKACFASDTNKTGITGDAGTTGQTQGSNYYELLTPLPATDGNTTAANFENPTSYIQGIFRLVVAVVIGLTVIMLAYGGIVYMTSDSIKNTSRGKEIVQRALWGLLLLLVSYLIIQTINPNAFSGLDNLVKTNFNVSSTTSPTAQN